MASGTGSNSTSFSSSEEDTPSGLSDDFDKKDEFSQARLERLGRQRPEIFPNLIAEIGFVSAIVISLMMSEYFTSGFNIILPSLTKTLSIPDALRTWPTAVPNLATAALLLPFGRLCDQLGSRFVFLSGHLWLMIWSVACGCSKSTIVIIICRAMQGVGFAAFLPSGIALLGHVYRPGPRKNMVYSIYGAFACLGFYAGIFVAAIAASFIDWRWYFWIGAIIELAIVLIGYLAIPKHMNDVNPLARMDWLGVCTIVPGLCLVIFSFTDGGHAPLGWKTPYIIVTMILGVLLLIAAVYTQGWMSAQPLLPAAIFRPKFMKRLVCGLFCYYGVFTLFLFYGSLYIENVLHASPIQAAAWYTPLAVGGVILAITGGIILHLVPSYVLMLLSSVGFLFCVLLFAMMPAQGGPTDHSTSYLYWAYIFPAMCCGTLGVDVMVNTTNVFFTTALPKKDQATVGAVINSLMCLGIAFWLGISEVVVLAVQNLRGGHVGLKEQYDLGFWLAVALSVLAFCFVVTVRIGSASADRTADEKAEAELETDGEEKEGLEGLVMEVESSDKQDHDYILPRLSFLPFLYEAERRWSGRAMAQT